MIEFKGSHFERDVILRKVASLLTSQKNPGGMSR